MAGHGLYRRFAHRTAVTLALCLGVLTLTPVAAGADEIEWMYDPDQVVEIAFSDLSPQELDKLEVDRNQEVPGTFELKVNGVSKGGPLAEVGIRLKGGHGSESPVKTGKSGFKVRFDEFVDDQLFFGIKRLTLNNMIQDPSMVHETLTYGLFHKLGLPASRTGYAFVTLNGAPYGLFLNIETLDEISLPQWFGEGNTQHLYEADAPGIDLVPGDAEKFEVDEGEEDISDLEGLIAAVNDEDGDWSDGVEAGADLERLTAQWAIERYVTHWDGYAGLPGDFRPNNYYLHSDASGVFQMMPWGTDQTWQLGFIPELDYVEFDEPAGGVMFNKCLADDDCEGDYAEALTDVYCAVSSQDLSARVSRLARMLAPYQALEDPVRREATEEEIAEEVEDVETFAEQRPGQLENYLTEHGALGGAVDPCAQPQPEDSTGPKLEPPAPPSTLPVLGFGPSKVVGNVVSTRVAIPGGGIVTQRVTARLSGRRIQVCSDRESRSTVAKLTVRCRLSQQAREARAEGPLRLRVRVGFSPEGGKARFANRVLSAPKRP
jgi:CotH kinase protein